MINAKTLQGSEVFAAVSLGTSNAWQHLNSCILLQRRANKGVDGKVLHVRCKEKPLSWVTRADRDCAPCSESWGKPGLYLNIMLKFTAHPVSRPYQPAFLLCSTSAGWSVALSQQNGAASESLQGKAAPVRN